MRFVFVLSLVLAACAPPHKKKKLLIDVDVQPYVTRFIIQHAAVTGQNLVIDNLVVVLAPGMPDYTLGACIYNTNPPFVELNADFWSVASDMSKEHLVDHELGHCILRRDHLDGTVPGLGIPLSIMSTYFFDDATYAPNRNYYLEELFTNAHAPRLPPLHE